ncbi:glycosyltransferase [Phyllobacterium sp. SB3]|uniref:glycosyltransferase family 2 protein n=1 Tax=Phyllobacterium sp. SB3 TaxID=3156073 RepID=UPI0032AEAB38
MTQPLRTICVGTVTRNRPIMLQALLDSYATMETPIHTRLVFVIIENNETATLHDIVERFRAKVTGCTVEYGIESRLGISFVRNRVLDFAISSGCDLLTFADDDEVVEPDWLVQLLAERDSADLDIVGGPVRLSSVENISVWKRMIWQAIKNMMNKGEMETYSKRASGAADKLWIATNNWMGDLDFFRSTGLRFDEGLGLNGGEDWKLYRQAKKAGAKTGWAPNAIVYETAAPERLTLAYQFKRSRDHCAIETRAKLKNRRLYTCYRTPGSILARLLKLIIQLIATPFTPGESLVRIAAYIGGIVGLIQAFTHYHSPHYQKTTGY